MLSLLLLQALAVEGGTVHSMIPGEEPRVATVLVEEGKILAVGPDLELPEDCERIDASGLHVVPGLIDGMVHHDLQHDPLYLLSGVSLARDMGNDIGRIFMAAEAGVRNTMPGPDLFICGPIFDGVPPATTEAAVARTPEEVNDKLPRLVDEGIQFATFHLGLPRPAWERLIELGHEYGLGVWGPIPRGLTLREVLAQEQDGVCYLEGFRGEDGALLKGESLQALVDQLAASGAALTPLMRVYGYRTEDPGEAPPSLAYLAPYYVDWWVADREARLSNFEADPEARARGQAGYAELEALLARLHEAGVPLVPGSGAPNPWLLPGEALHEELAAFVAAGIPPYETLRHATSGAAAALGLAEVRGSIRTGLVADLVLSTADPRETLEPLRRPAGLVIRGVHLDGEYLDGLREAIIEQQAQARLEASKPLAILKPELPEGTVVLEGRDDIAARRDADEAREHPVEPHRQIEHACAQAHVQQGGAESGSAREVGYEDDGADRTCIGAQGATAIKPKPSQPEDQHAEGCEREVVGGQGTHRAILFVLGAARTDDPSASEGHAAADCVHHRAAREVVKAHFGEPTTSPHPVADDRIEHGRSERGEDEERGQPRAFCHRARNDRGGGGGEDELKEKKNEERQVVGGAGDRIRWLGCETGESDELVALAKHQTKAEEEKNDRSDGDHSNVLQQHHDSVLLSAETALHEGEPRVHEEHEERGHHDPHAVQHRIQDASFCASESRLCGPPLGAP